MGFFESDLTGGEGFSSTTPEMASWYDEALRNLTAGGFAAANQPYQVYPGQAIAGFTPQQQQAFDLTGAQVGAWKPQLTQAGALTQQSAQYDPEMLQRFLSPYTKGVVDELGRLGQRNFQENLLPQTLASFTGGGQFGSMRSQDAAMRAARDTQADILGRQQGALQQAYQQAGQNYGDWANRGLSAGAQLGNVSQLGQTMGLRDISALQAAGQAQQAQQQNNLNYAQQQFQQEQQYPWQQLSNLSNIVRGLPAGQLTGSAGTVTNPNAVPTPFSQILGGLTQVGGLL